MDLKIKRDVFKKVTVQLKEEQVSFMEQFRDLILENNPELKGITEHEVYQKAFEFLMSDKRITAKMGSPRKKKTTIGDLRVG